jgi:hypothetical protein
MPFDDVVETKIQDAMAAGVFDRLQGAGKPFRYRPSEEVGENWMGYKVLQNGGFLPDWLALAREIELDLEDLQRIERRHDEWVELASTGGQWERHGAALRGLRMKYEQRARSIRSKQDRFNHDAPSISLERPGIWVEYHLERLIDRLREAGAPEWLLLPQV